MKNGKIKAVAVLVAAVTMIFTGCTRSTSESGQPQELESTAWTGEDSGLADGNESTETAASSGGGAHEGGTEAGRAESSEGSTADTLTGGFASEEARPLIQKKIVTATDIHYLAESLAGNRCQSFMSVVETGDGSVLQYGWEILDAFIEDMLKEKPDLIVLSGDLTFDGERESHEELAEKLQVLLKQEIPVIVIPGNHDINNHNARKFTSDGTEMADSVTAEEFAAIYADYGYVAADSRDPASLSYTYKLDDYYWLLMLDSCQYDPTNQIGGMIRRETYEWMTGQMEEAWNEGAQFISVSHHNLLDQSGVSRDFYDNCTIEHNEELVQALSDGQVRLHLSGHLHLQHYLEQEGGGLYEIVTGSLVMAPCRYGVLKIMDSGDLIYDARSADVDGWAKRHSYKNKDLAGFKDFSERFLRQVAYRNAVLDLRQHTVQRKLSLSDERIDEMARFYAKLCVYYYGGRMFEIDGDVKADAACGYWNEVDYISDLADFLKNILSDSAKDFSHLEIPY